MSRGSPNVFSLVAHGFAGVAALSLAACVGGGSGGGGGGGGGGPTVVTAGKDGDQCNPTLSTGGCNAQKPMVCTKDTDPANGAQIQTRAPILF